MGGRGNNINFDELYSLKVDNLAYNTSIYEVRRLFERYGEIGDIYLPRDRYNNTSRGFGFVRYYSKKDADYAVDRADGKDLNGRTLRVSIAKYKRPSDEERERRRRRSRSRSRSPRHRRSSPRYRSRSRSRSRSEKRHRSRTASRSRSRSPRSRSPVHSRSRSPTPRD